ncbi:MAG: tetratricopeptide repeat protein [Xanthomonadales bacterium]|nr:tetratricopeptide repeat protein [Xanthomonadales bacterium]
MRTRNSGAGFLPAAILASTLLSGQAFAQADGCGIERNVTPKPLDEQTWKRMNDVYEDIGDENYDIAYEKLTSMAERARGGDYLKAIIQQLIGQVQWARENYDAALKGFEDAVRLNALPDNTHYSLMYQIAQLYYMKERYNDALKSLDVWFCKAPAEKIKSSAYVLKASIFAAKEDWRNVIPSIEQAIGMEDEPKEAWYNLKLASHLELDQKPQARDTLKILIKHWPNKKIYWIQLSNIYFQLENDPEALAVSALAYKKNLLDKQADFLYLSNLYSVREVPYKAAAVLQDGIERGIVEATEKHWTMIADAWYSAEEMENALAAYVEAGAAADDGDIDLRRGYILIDMERWEDARDALKMAIEKGGINERQEGEAHLMVGMAEFSLGNYDDASAAWGRAMRFDRSKKAAEQWMAHLREERARNAP